MYHNLLPPLEILQDFFPWRYRRWRRSVLLAQYWLESHIHSQRKLRLYHVLLQTGVCASFCQITEENEKNMTSVNPSSVDWKSSHPPVQDERQFLENFKLHVTYPSDFSISSKWNTLYCVGNVGHVCFKLFATSIDSDTKLSITKGIFYPKQIPAFSSCPTTHPKCTYKGKFVWKTKWKHTPKRKTIPIMNKKQE